MTSRDGLCMFCVLKPLVQRQDMTEEDLQMRPHIPRMGPEGGRVNPEVESAIHRACCGGHPLEGALQKQMSATLGHDFREVRVHTGPEADELNRHLGARAFTIGSDVFFKRGAYDPASMSGRQLIAHELVHVVQLSTGRVSGCANGMTVRPEGDVFEQEAENLARQVAAAPDGHSARDRQHTFLRSELRPTVIQRQLPRLINAARNQIHPLTAESNALCPKNCHEAVLGWFLTSMNYPRRWRLIREAAKRHPDFQGQPEISRQFLSTWMWTDFYMGHTQQVNFNNIRLNTHQGDILVVGLGQHSMVVVENPQAIPGVIYPAPAGTQTHRVYIRGFNNIGSFNQLLGSANAWPPYDPGYHPVPMSTSKAAAYDAYNRDVANPRLWNSLPANPNLFGLTGVSLYVVSYAAARNLVAQHFPWENSPIPITIGQRWHYNQIKGWRWF